MGNQQGKDPNLDRQGDTFGAGKKPHSGDNGQAPQDQPTNNSNNVNVGGGGIAKNAASKVTGAYNGVAGKVGKGIQKSANYVNVSIGDKATKVLSHVLIWSVLGGVGYGIYQYSQQNPLYSGNVCSTLNDNGDVYGGMDNVEGASGEWTQKGTKAYVLAQAIWKAAKSVGLDDTHAAALLGNAENEGAANGNLQEAEHGGGGGAGIFQFTDQSPKYGWSVEGQVKSILANGDSGWSSRNSSLYQLSDDFCANIERPQYNNFDDRRSASKKAYEMFKGTVPDVSLADSNAADAEAGNDANCNNTTEQNNSSDMATIAHELVGYFGYDQGQRMDLGKNGLNSIHSISDLNKSGHADCSSFVWVVMKLSGKKVPPTPFTTMTMLDDMHGPKQYLKEIPESDAKKGDIVITNGSVSDGHTGILTEDWHGDSTMVANEADSSPNAPVDEKPYNWSFQSLLSYKPVFARPVS